MIKAIIFDLDGVIVSTDEFHYQAWKMLTDKENIHFDQEINQRLRGVSREKSLDIILEKATNIYTILEKEEMLRYKNEKYLSLIDQLTRKDILPGVLDLIEYLKKKDIRIAIGSSSKNAHKILTRIGLIDTFDAITDGWDVKNTKPAPDIFLNAARRLYIDPIYCGVVEDAVAGIKAAKAAKMFAIAINDATNSDEADLKIKNLYEIISYLESN